MYESFVSAITPEAIESFFAIGVGFAFAGLCASGYRLFGPHFPSLKLLEVGPMGVRFALIPLLVFSAPFLIMRNTLRGRRFERRHAGFVMVATVVAALWSLMSGTLVMMALHALMNV
jgi:hypothetical protein